MPDGNGNLPNFDLSLLDVAEEEAEKDRQTAKDVYPKISAAVAFLEKASGSSREALEKPPVVAKIIEAQEALAKHRLHEVPAVRRAVWKALLDFELTRPHESREEVEKLLDNLVQQGLLIKDPGGYLSAYGQRYLVNPDSLFGDPEKAEAKESLEKLLREVKRRMLKQGDLSLDELKSGKSGKCAMEVPVAQETGKDGRPIWRGGGVLVVESDGSYIQPKEAMGAIEGAIGEAIKLGVKLSANTLRLKNPPFFEGLTEDALKKTILLWHLIKRAERLADERKAFPSKATIGEEEFFLQDKPGTCLIDLGQTVWEEWDQGKITNRIFSVFFLVRREEEEGAKWLHIVEVPSHLVNFLAPCMGRYEEGYKFEGVPQPSRKVLQAAYGHVSRKAEKTAKLA